MINPAELFRVVQNGGPDVILLLLIFITLLLGGSIRLKREIEGKEEIIRKLEELNNGLLTRIDRQQDLHERSLDMLEQQIPNQLKRARS